MPSVASLDELRQAVAEFPLTGLPLTVEPAARATAQRSLDESGLLLLGEIHGVAENPLLIRALLAEFGLSGLALEWPAELTPTVGAFLAGGHAVSTCSSVLRTSSTPSPLASKPHVLTAKLWRQLSAQVVSHDEGRWT